MNWYNKFIKKAAIKLYHGSRKEFPIGFILQPQATGYVHDEIEIEKIVDQYRPPNKISRFESVFMVDNPELIEFAGGYEDFIYLVEPIGQVDKSNLSWYSDVSVYLDSTPEEQKMCSLNYWNGVPYKNRRNGLWEHRARQARIIAVISGE